MTRGELVYLRTRFESGEALQTLATEVELSGPALLQRWARAELTSRAVAHAHRHLAGARRRAGLTQAQAARRVGVGERTWRRAELGQVLLAPGRIQTWLDVLEGGCS